MPESGLSLLCWPSFPSVAPPTHDRDSRRPLSRRRPCRRGDLPRVHREPDRQPEFQDYEPEIAALPGKYAAPRGLLLLAWRDGRAVGCAAFREIDATTCEMKRVYVRPEARGLNVGRQLVERLLHDAKAAGYARMCLDVLPEFVAARKLYASLGFAPAPPVAFNPVPGAEFRAGLVTSSPSAPPSSIRPDTP